MLLRRTLKLIRRRCRRLASRLNAYSERMARRFHRWVGLHYCIADSSFRREQKAVVAGRAMFGYAEHCPADSSSLLRRSIHRIEKGLISRPRRSVFAVDYIGRTVDVYERMVVKNQDCRELAWAHDVLASYFDACEGDSEIEAARVKFEKLPGVEGVSIPDRASGRTPYQRLTPKSPVQYEALLGLARQRRSVRWFDGRPVPRKKLLQALDVATLSPSACNRQPFTFRVFDREPHLSVAAGLPPGTRGYEHQFPCVIAVVGKQRYYSLERDRHLIYVDGSLATMSFILALETLGLSSCCIHWPDIEEREVAAEKALKLEADERIVMFIAVGYADPEGLIPYSEKRLPEELCRFNFE